MVSNSPPARTRSRIFWVEVLVQTGSQFVLPGFFEIMGMCFIAHMTDCTWEFT